MNAESLETLATYTVAQVAEKLHVPVRTIQRWCELDVLQPESGTRAGGKGTHRRLNHNELQIAAILAAMAERFVGTHHFQTIATKLRHGFVPPDRTWGTDEPLVEAHRRVLFCDDERTPWLLLGFRGEAHGQEVYEVGIVNRPAHTTFAPQEGGGAHATIQECPLAEFKTVELFNLKKILTPVLREHGCRQAARA